MYRLQRFHWKRRWAALALLPAIAMMAMSGFAMAAGKAPSSTGSGVHLRVSEHARVGQSVKIRGRVSPGASRLVTISVNGRTLDTTQSQGDGRFGVRWRTPESGIYTIRASAVDEQRAAAGSDEERLNVYRAAQASYYGPGLYGGHLACGGTLTPSKLGVAHKTLTCGTRVTLRYRGRTVTVPVIDRGPYAGNREYDLTAATKAKLRFGSTGAVLTTR